MLVSFVLADSKVVSLLWIILYENEFGLVICTSVLLTTPPLYYLFEESFWRLQKKIVQRWSFLFLRNVSKREIDSKEYCSFVTMTLIVGNHGRSGYGGCLND